MTGFRTTVLAAGSLALALQGASAEGPCGDVNGVMKTVVSMAPECFATCKDVCKPLGTVVTKYLAKDDPWDTVCSNAKVFNCPFETDACKSILATASAMKLPVPASLEELEEKCPAAKKSSKKSGEAAPASDKLVMQSSAGSAATDNSTTTAEANTTTTTAEASTTTAAAEADENTTDAAEIDANTTVAPVSAAAGLGVPGAFAALTALAAFAA